MVKRSTYHEGGNGGDKYCHTVLVVLEALKSVLVLPSDAVVQINLALLLKDTCNS